MSTGHAVLDALLGIAVALGALTTIFTAFAKVPPLRALVRFIGGRIFGPAWRAVVVDPIKAWFHAELREGVRPVVEHTVRETVGKSVAQAVPPAVRKVVGDTVAPQLEGVREELADRAERVRVELREHMVGEEQHRAEEIEHRRELTHAVQAQTEQLGRVEDRLVAVEAVIEKPLRLSGEAVRMDPSSES